MSSSSWHLIHADRPELDPAVEEAPAVPQPPVQRGAGGAPSVLRGRMRTQAGRSAGARGALAQSAQGTSLPGMGLPGLPGSAGMVDAEALAAEIGRIEAEAEQRGYESGRVRAMGELQAAIAGAGALAARLQETAPDRTADIAHSVAELALSVAKRILQHEVRTDPTALCGALEAAVSTINGSPEAHVLLNPAAVDRVREAWEALHGRAYLGKRWVFEGDPNLPLGGCTLRYDHGFVEAGLEAQLEEIGIALDRAIPGIAHAATEEDVA